MASSANTRKALDQAFDAFEDALRQALESEAQRSVQAYLSTLDQNQRFRVEDSNIKVTVAGLTLSTSTPPRDAAGPMRVGGRAKSPAKDPAKKPKPKGRRSSGADRAGSARQALLDVLRSDTAKQWTTDEIREGLTASEVEVSATNLHQLLRRVSATDEVDRVARGQYQARGA